jgi:hypothetical protein
MTFGPLDNASLTTWLIVAVLVVLIALLIWLVVWWY